VSILAAEDDFSAAVLLRRMMEQVMKEMKENPDAHAP